MGSTLELVVERLEIAVAPGMRERTRDSQSARTGLRGSSGPCR